MYYIVYNCKINRESTKEAEEPAIVPTLRPSGPARTVLAIR